MISLDQSRASGRNVPMRYAFASASLRRNEEQKQEIGMKLAAIMVCIAIAAAFEPALAAPSSEGAVDAPIDRVTVFSDRAEVVRAARVACRGSGPMAVTFPPLPAGIAPASVRASASAPAAAVGVASRQVSLEHPLDPEVEAISSELEGIAERLTALGDALDTAKERHAAARAYADYLAAVLREQARSDAPRVDEWSRALDIVAEERERLAESRLTIAAEKRDLERRADLLRRRLAAHQGSTRRPARAYQVTVTLECEGAGRAPVELAYVTRGATWAPEYDLRFDAEGGDGVGPGRAKIEVAAVVRQSTGEDWADARVSLTTARPELGAAAPEPAPIYVDGHEVGKHRVLVQETEDRRSLPSAGAAPDAGDAAHASVDDGGRSFTLNVPGTVMVRSDSRPYRFPIDSLTADAVGLRVAVPKLSPFVYRVVRAKNPASYPLLAGPMQVFRDGAYVGRLAVEYAPPGAPMEISLGPDETVRVARRELTEVDRDPGCLQRTKRMERAYRIEVENETSGPVTVQIRESIPVSRVGDVRVALGERETTEGYELDRERGILSWLVELAEGGRSEIDVAFSVRLPDDWELAVAR